MGRVGLAPARAGRLRKGPLDVAHADRPTARQAPGDGAVRRCIRTNPAAHRNKRDPVSCLDASSIVFRKHASVAVLSVRPQRPVGNSGYPSNTTIARSTATAR